MPYIFKEVVFYFDLQTFAEGEGGADMAGSETGSESALASASENPSSDGVATGAEGEQTTTANQSDETWDSLIKGKYKKEYSRAVNQAINKRFRNQSQLQNQLQSMDPLIRGMAAQYGIKPDQNGNIPIDQLMDRYNNDNARYEDEAFKRGMSVDDLKLIKNQEREIAQLRAQTQRSERDRAWGAIEQEANNLKSMYPDLDLETEMVEPRFASMMATFQNSGFPNPVQMAYEAMHRDEIMASNMKYAVQRTSKQISNSIQSGQRRPSENGSGNQSAAQIGAVDPSKLTTEQIRDYVMRAQRGERITFR